MQVGQSRKEAYLALAAPTTGAELRCFLRAVIQADEYGIAVADVLRTQAIELRLKRRQRAEEKAMKITVKVIFPLMLLHSARVVHGAARASRAGHDESIQRHVSGHNDECNAIERGTRGRCLVCCALTRCIKAFLGVAALHYLRSAPLRRSGCLHHAGRPSRLLTPVTRTAARNSGSSATPTSTAEPPGVPRSCPSHPGGPARRRTTPFR